MFNVAKFFRRKSKYRIIYKDVHNLFYIQKRKWFSWEYLHTYCDNDKDPYWTDELGRAFHARTKELALARLNPIAKYDGACIPNDQVCYEIELEKISHNSIPSSVKVERNSPVFKFDNLTALPASSEEHEVQDAVIVDES